MFLMENIVKRCIDATDGSIVKLAAELGIKHQSFYAWKKIPAERVIDLERVTGIPRHELRPDLYRGRAPRSREAAE